SPNRPTPERHLRRIRRSFVSNSVAIDVEFRSATVNPCSPGPQEANGLEHTSAREFPAIWTVNGERTRVGTGFVNRGLTRSFVRESCNHPKASRRRAGREG